MIDGDDGCLFGQAVPDGETGLVMTHFLGCEQFRFTPSDWMVIRCRSRMEIDARTESAELTKIQNEGERDHRGPIPRGLMFQGTSALIRRIDDHDPIYLTIRFQSV